MNKYIQFLSITAFILYSNISYAGTTDSVKVQRMEITIAVDTQKNTPAVNKSNADCNTCKKCNPENVNTPEWLLIMLPTILFLLLFYYYMGWLKRDAFKIADALSSCDPVTLTQEIKNAEGAVTASTNTQVMARSSSRLIAFLTGLTAMTIGICLTTYYIFITVADCPDPDLDGLWKIIAALGIGIIPYGANMWKESKKDNN